MTATPKHASLDIGVIGAGSWGTALALLLAHNHHRVTLWVYEKEVCDHIASHRENHIFLPGVHLPESIRPTRSLPEACRSQDLLVSAVPSHLVRKIMRSCGGHISPHTLLVSVSKGIENKTLKPISGILRDVLPSRLLAHTSYLSGPSFAREVAQQLPTAVVVAAKDGAVVKKVQETFASPRFRVYASDDIIGVELGGALKNVIAIAAGCSDGLGFGHNTRAALITRGLAEITRLGVALGANPLTFAGLSGLGDLVLTCTGALSRNRQVGLKLAEGLSLADILAHSAMVAEGIKTTKAAYALAKKHRIEMPIVEQVYRILYQRKDPCRAVSDLMSRSLRHELDKCLTGCAVPETRGAIRNASR